ncbi:hypothetical protein EVAR_11101_1 [Eumeta japonica]|uniref:Uncharacterized protein n=1 Tax=Eumeta variegata TaxID=151549 RepID=A0A4C1U4A0_EUMVA|nr:hypothetical protein EVAR_11101_1 [Eumeta japonica]
MEETLNRTSEKKTSLTEPNVLIIIRLRGEFVIEQNTKIVNYKVSGERMKCGDCTGNVFRPTKNVCDLPEGNFTPKCALRQRCRFISSAISWNPCARAVASSPLLAEWIRGDADAATLLRFAKAGLMMHDCQ